MTLNMIFSVAGWDKLFVFLFFAFTFVDNKSSMISCFYLVKVLHMLQTLDNCQNNYS